MIIRYHTIENEEQRDIVKQINSCGHAAYIAYMMLKRYNFEKINEELTYINLETFSKKSLQIYFRHALAPLLRKYGMYNHYQRYEHQSNDLQEFEISKNFLHDDDGRKNYIKYIIKETQTSVFFIKEIKEHFKGRLPRENGKPIIDDTPGDYMEVLTHSQRHQIDNFLSHGRDAKEIVEHLKAIGASPLNNEDIEAYRKGFLNASSLSITDMITDLQNQLNTVEANLRMMRQNNRMTIGKKTASIKNLTLQKKQLETKISKMQSMYASNAFGSAVIEYNDMRDMFADALQRSHKRFVKADRRTEDAAVDVMHKLLAMMDKSTHRILDLDGVMSAVQTKSISDEMLEIIKPNLERLEEEERKSIKMYESQIHLDEYDEAEDIIGLD